MRQTNVSFGLKKIGLHVLGEKNRGRRGRKRKKRKRRKKKWEKTKKVCFHFGIMCNLDF